MQNSYSWSSPATTREVTVVEIRNPIIQQKKNGKRYTDFEICLKSNSKAFTIGRSSVRRRYSDFVWLRNWLSENNEGFSSIRKTPSLPPKKLIGRFEVEFIQNRMKGLQRFLRKVIEQNVFLSDKALHLFLQSNLSVKQIENYLTGKPVDDNDCVTTQKIMNDNGNSLQEEVDPPGLSRSSTENITSLQRITEDSENCSSIDSDTVICFGSEDSSPVANVVEGSTRRGLNGQKDNFICESFSSAKKHTNEDTVGSAGSDMSQTCSPSDLDFVFHKPVYGSTMSCRTDKSEELEDIDSGTCFIESKPMECPPKFSLSVDTLSVGSSPEVSDRGLIAAVPIIQSYSQ
ncbi:sorting nexin-10A-like [Rhopilema esculentum]|uniref:sorting nexin-10A-like n=1 Tax=Rhopilema esculentum TaxID=499914 RepID=UPI0031CDF5B7